MPTIAQAVVALMEEEGRRFTWFGHLDLWGAAHQTATGRNAHPKDAWESVRHAMSVSPLFAKKGRIRAADWAGREILHPRFELVPKRASVGRFFVSYDLRAVPAPSTKYMVVRIVTDGAYLSRSQAQEIAGPLPYIEAGALVFAKERAILEDLPSESECEALMAQPAVACAR
ncbi:hypothetical protein [Paraburkholderia youngii]|uniref:hypothetical protein n=1 Tax=Paraburkholderia youngii TaxID=2782701 RepID=UPI003D250AF5